MSRDVVFEENKAWIWNASDKTREPNSNSFNIDVRSFSDNDKTEPGAAVLSETENEAEDEAEDDGDNVDEEDDGEHTQLRRSTRISSKPTYLDDYVLLTEAEGERLLMVLNDEPWDYNEAKELKVWVDACKDEIFSIQKNKTWFLLIFHWE